MSENGLSSVAVMTDAADTRRCVVDLPTVVELVSVSWSDSMFLLAHLDYVTKRDSLTNS